MLQFNEAELVLGGVPGFPMACPYSKQGTPGGYSTTGNVHNGQRKLLLSEIEFLTQVLHIPILGLHSANDGKTFPPLRRYLCVYAGACPCTHLDDLLELFPNICFVLVDPRFGSAEYKRYQTRWDTRRVAVCANVFDDNTAQAVAEWASGRHTHHWIHAKLKSLDLQQDEVGYDHLLFISDVRSDALDEHAIAKDMDAQQRWFRILYASAGLLKFRLPFCNDKWYKEYAQHNGVRSYLHGTIYLPIWGPPSTTECRLYVRRGCGVKNYSPKEHESIMAGFESHDRKQQYMVANRVFHSFDEAAEMSVLLAYQLCMSHYGYTARLCCLV